MRFISVPAFVFALDVKVDVPEYGTVKVDVSYGGAFYAFIPAKHLGTSVVPVASSQVLISVFLVSNDTYQYLSFCISFL